MKIGFSLLNNWGIGDPQALVGLAVRAEELGLDSVWVHDHVFNVGHVFDRIGGRPYYEPLTLLSFVAARTTRITSDPGQALAILEMVGREVVAQ
jgi:alkanesulfonate monooxygenase SsuD/methylene tetrahydromethanopterin reductase-like flavin-dependent oxidoreductase (luciferase family)